MVNRLLARSNMATWLEDQREPDAVLAIHAHGVGVKAAIHLVLGELLGDRVEFDQAALVRRREEDVPIVLRLGQRVDALIGLVAGKSARRPGSRPPRRSPGWGGTRYTV